MKSKPNIGLAALAMALAVISTTLGSLAADSDSAAGPAGTWKVTYTRDGKTQAYQPTLKLKQEGDKWTGTFTRRHGQQDIEMALEDAKIEAGEISFTITVPGNGVNMVRKFRGKITGDAIKEGTVKDDLNGVDPSLDHPLHWEAERVKE
jgi:hypothetical protein